MPINIERVRRARAMIDPSPAVPQLRSHFQSLASDLSLARLVGDADQHPKMAGHVRVIGERVSQLVTVGHKLQWQLTEHADGRLPWDAWIHFASLDLTVFFMLLRSTLDHVAGVIAQVTPAKHGHRRRFSSFHKLRALAHTPEGLEYLGEEIRDFVTSCDWFGEVKEWRDSIVHDGSHLFVTNEGMRPVFVILPGTRFAVEHPEVMQDTNVVDFWRFAGLYVSYLLCLLEDLAHLARKNLSTLAASNASFRHPGLLLLQQAMDQLAG